ncbi:MAG: V-type ATP synthase subunit I [Promethearchaeota archaeon]
MKKHDEMTLFRVTINKNYKDKFLNQLSQIRNVHIKERTNLVEKKSEQSSEVQVLINKLKKLRQLSDSLFKKLNIKAIDLAQLKVENKEIFSGKNLEEIIDHVTEETNFYVNRINELERYIAKASIEFEAMKLNEECFKFLNDFGLNRTNLNYFSQLGFRVYTTFKKNLENLLNLFEFEVFPNVNQWKEISDERIIFFVIYPKDKKNDLRERIKLIHAEEIPILKKYLLADKINFDRISKEIDYIEKTLSKYELEIQYIRDKNLPKFAAIDEVIKNIEEYFWAEQQFEEVSPNNLVLKFFIPLDDKEQVKNQLIKIFKDKIIFDTIDISKKRRIVKSRRERRARALRGRQGKKEEESDLRNEAPTIMRNFFLFRPFETLTKMYGVPAYSEIDPTPFIAITFPLLFGLMFGDIGHGIVLIIAGLVGGIFFRNKGENLRNFSWIIFYCGWGSVLAGFLYGEFFGMHEMFGQELRPVVIGNFTLHNPLENITTVFKFTILVGVIHINLGWIIQFMNYWKQSQKYLAITDSFVKILFLTGGTILIFIWQFDLKAWLSEPYPILLPVIPGILLIILKPLGKVLGVPYLQEESYSSLLGEGSMETFETFLSVLSNVASYVRLLALALAHIALMIAIQAMISLIQVENIFMQILVIIGLIFGNVVVILLEGILVFINALRLHFYEFFFKFYKGSGKEFFPFYMNSNFSNIEIALEREVDMISEEIEKEIVVKKAQEHIKEAKDYILNKYL